MQDTVQIIIPNILDLENTLNFISALQTIPTSDGYAIDFSQLEWIEPFALLCLSHEIKRFMDHRSYATFKAINYTSGEANRYAAHMGFFRSIGLDYGTHVSEVSDNSHYIPIRALRVDAVTQRAVNKRIAVGDELEDYSKNMATILVQQSSGILVDNIKFSLREMLRNVVEHSQAKKIAYCAQYWPEKNTIEVAILDSGIGIHQSLKENPYLKMTSDKDALYFSLLPGISGKMYKGKYSDPNDVWENSGFGLFMTSELCRNGGSFFICSNTAGVILTEQEKKDLNTDMHGTALRLIINTKNILEITKSLKKYLSKGQKLAKEMYGANINASTASTMLIQL